MNRNYLKITAPQGSQVAIALCEAGTSGRPVMLFGIAYLVGGINIQTEQCEVVFDLVKK